MSTKLRIMISVGILLVDSVLFFIPLSAVFLAYVILSNPPWFRNFLNSMDADV